MKPSTVGELIAQLQKLDPSTLVETEGCDCVGPWSGSIEERGSGDKKYVTIGREDDRPWPPDAPAPGNGVRF